MGTLGDDRIIACVRRLNHTTLLPGAGGALVATDRLFSNDVWCGREPSSGVSLASFSASAIASASPFTSSFGIAFRRVCRERARLRAVRSGRLVCFIPKQAEARAAPLELAYSWCEKSVVRDILIFLRPPWCIRTRLFCKRETANVAVIRRLGKVRTGGKPADL